MRAGLREFGKEDCALFSDTTAPLRRPAARSMQHVMQLAALW
jgi:hypothetical protein